MIEPKIVIVTGGAGMIGSAIVWELNRRGITDIVIVDHLGDSEKWRNLRALKFLDYMEKDQFIEKVRNNSLSFAPKSIFHMGACSSTTEKDASYLARNNFEYSRDLAMCALNKNVRFIYASSAATYGDGDRGYGDDEHRLDELRPLNMYGYSKQLFDQWAYRHKLLDRIVGLKFFNVFGPNEWHKGDMRSMVVKAWEQIKSSGSINLFKSHHPDYADGEQKRDFIYVKDAARMSVFFQEEGQRANGLFNIGTGRASTWNQLAKGVFAALNLPPKINYIDMPEILREKYQYFTQADMHKMKNSGYAEKQWDLADAIADYVQNYLNPGNHLGDEEGNE